MKPRTGKPDVFLPVSLSGADPVGILYTNGSVFLRGIHESGVGQIQTLLDSTFWEELSKRDMVPKTRILEKNSVPASMQHFPLVLEHETLSPVTYPYEWSFEMVKATALAFLDLIKLADSNAYTVKDAHLNNWLFRGVQPVWVDIGSFTPLSLSSNILPWSASFYSNVLTPLNLWCNGMPLLANRAVSCPGRLIRTDEAIACNHPIIRGQGAFARNLRFILRVLFFAHNIPNNTLLRRSVKHVFAKKPMRQVSHYRDHIQRLSYVTSSQWGQYQTEFVSTDNQVRLHARFKRILDLIQEYSPSSILELAGNAGVLSQAIAEKMPGIPVICTDYDSDAIDFLFRRIQKSILPNFSVAVLDFMSTAINSAEIKPQTRFQSDCVIALAVTHHLLLSQGFQYDQIFKTIQSYSDRLVFIEYMPLGLHDGHWAPEFPLWYNQKNFEESFSEFFTIVHIEQLDSNRILYIGQIRANNRK